MVSDKEDLRLQLAEVPNESDESYTDNDQDDNAPSLLERWIDWSTVVDA